MCVKRRRKANSEFVIAENPNWCYWTAGQRTQPYTVKRLPFVWKLQTITENSQTRTDKTGLAYKNWKKGQPDYNDAFKPESCLAMMSCYRCQWNDINCKNTCGFVCEIDM